MLQEFVRFSQIKEIYFVRLEFVDSGCGVEADTH